MSHYKSTQSFIDGLTAYLTDSEMDYSKYFEIMTCLDVILDLEPTLVAVLFFGGKDQADRAFAEGGKRQMVETVSLWIRTKLAKDKLGLYLIGLLKTNRKGDLRGSEMIENWQEHALAMLRFKSQRTTPSPIEIVEQEIARRDWKAVERLARGLNKPPITLENLNISRLQGFFLNYWVIKRDDLMGRQIPPLCYCSDPTIAKLADIYGIQANVTPKLVRKTWERLGLQKSSRILFWDAYLQTVKRSGRSVRVPS